MRVLFVSDVYFPRVNGVSTSVATFRADLAATGVETELVAPQYGEPSLTPMNLQLTLELFACHQAACRATRKAAACVGVSCSSPWSACAIGTMTWCIFIRRFWRTTLACASHARRAYR